MALVALVIAGSAFVSSAAAQTAQKRMELSGQIVSVDRVARTLTVVDNVSGRVFMVQVPPHSLVGIEPTASLPAAIPFAHVVRGLKFRAVVFENKFVATR